jgi:hypothetical protein
MASKTDICNFALSEVGAKRITAVTEDNERARICDLYYDPTRKEVLEAHTWGSAMARVSVAEDASDPTWGYDNRFSLPEDYIRMVSIDSVNRRSWEIEGNYVVTNEDGPLKMKYVFDLTDTTKMSPTFVRAFSLLLALRIAKKIANPSAARMKELLDNYTLALIDAKRFDGRERSSQKFADTTWITARG